MNKAGGVLGYIATIIVLISVLSSCGSSQIDSPVRESRWHADSNGWWYSTESGYATGWTKIEGKWRYFDSAGYLKKGWQEIDGQWYYLSSNGTMLTGWQKINNKWYFLQRNGVMKVGWMKWNDEWYLFGRSGAMATGWAKAYGRWFFLGEDGKMHTSEWIDGYWVDEDGAWVKGKTWNK